MMWQHPNRLCISTFPSTSNEFAAETGVIRLLEIYFRCYKEHKKIELICRMGIGFGVGAHGLRCGHKLGFFFGPPPW